MEHVEDLLVVVLSACLSHKFLRLHRHLILVVHLNLSFDMFSVESFFHDAAGGNLFGPLSVFNLEQDFFVEAVGVEFAVQTLTLRNVARHVLVLLVVNEGVLVWGISPESCLWQQLC